MSKPRIESDKTHETLKPYQPLGIPMLQLLLGVAAISMLITVIYEYFF